MTSKAGKSTPINKLSVFINLEDEDLKVGELAETQGRVFFEYDSEFVQRGLEISPFKLPLEKRFFEDISRHELFGLPGVIYDSLPDGWGILVMDRMFRSHNIDPDSVSALARLAYLGDRAMGALRYEPVSDLFSNDALRPLDLAELANESELILNGKTDTVIKELIVAGGSPGGARPKALVGLNPESNAAIYGISKLPSGFDHYVVKFKGFREHHHVGYVEFIYSLLARRAGIDIPETHLVQSGEQHFFAIKRFDRQGTHRFHTHTLAGLLHSDFRKPEASYSHLFKVTEYLTRDHQAVCEAFRRMIFNILSFNRDDHSKNFSFMLNKAGQWTLSPAYDLVYSQGMAGWHTLDISGSQHPSRKDVIELASKHGIKAGKANQIIDQVREALLDWPKLVEQYQIDPKLSRQIEQARQQCQLL